MAKSHLTNAKKAKNDEFYTQFEDIQKEIFAYTDFDANVFRGKTIYCNCDDPYESNFFRFFALNFKKLGLKKLITTSYQPSPVALTQLDIFGLNKPQDSTLGVFHQPAIKFVVSDVNDTDRDGDFDMQDIAQQLKANKHNEWAPLEGNGDFRNPESIELLKQADIVITNPPFSLFREYLKQLLDYQKKFLIIGNMNAITYKEVFPLLKENKVWLGNNYKVNGGAMFFEIPEEVANLDQVREIKTDEQGKRVYITRVQGVRWFTNLDHGRRHEPMPLMTMEDNLKFSKHLEIKGKSAYVKYDNYDAIEVPYIDSIPNNYPGIMGVPVSILDKFNPDQFEIVGLGNSRENFSPNKNYLNPKKILSDGTVHNGNAINCVLAIETAEKPGGEIYYTSDNSKYLIAPYARVLIRHKHS